jgi:uncharacterized protein RhaS with RHS repeats
MNGRVYDPAIGRFMSADPFVDGAETTQGWNRFSYVHNRPVVLTDPSGFEKAGGEFNTKTLPVSPGWDPSLSDGIRDRIIVEAMRWSDFLDLTDNLRDLKVLADLAFGSGGDGAGGGGNDGSERDNNDWKCEIPEVGAELGVDVYQYLGSSISVSVSANVRTGQMTVSVSLGFGVGVGGGVRVGRPSSGASFSSPSSNSSPVFGGGINGTIAVYAPVVPVGFSSTHQFLGSNAGSTTVSPVVGIKGPLSPGAAFANLSANASISTPALYETSCDE